MAASAFDLLRRESARQRKPGDLFLVYPMTASFNQPLPVFAYSQRMRLWVVPFDLQAGVLVGNPLFVDGGRLDAAA